MKNIIGTVVILVISIFVFTACNSKSFESTESKKILEEGSIAASESIQESIENSKEKTLEDKIRKSACWPEFESLYKEVYSADEKALLEAQVKAYLVKYFTGTYELQSDRARSIYMPSMDEIYISTYSRDQLDSCQMSLEDIRTEINESYGREAYWQYDYVGFDGEWAEFSSRIFDGLSVYYKFGKNSNCLIENEYSLTSKKYISQEFYRYGSEELLDANNREKARAQAIEPKEPTIGMTADEVEKSTWGKPTKKNIDTYEWGIKEQWIYSNGYIYLEDGVVTSVSER